MRSLRDPDGTTPNLVRLAPKRDVPRDFGAASLSDIALRCGFTDQAHLCKHFRQALGQTPAAWRRAHSSHHDEDETLPVERLGLL
jgi:AraC-like DNA-binding protein